MKRLTLTLAALALTASACGADGGSDGSTDSAADPATGGRDLPALVIGGIPDQDVSLLKERFDGVADHLSEELGFPVRYQASTDYAAVVTAFSNGDVQLGWFGGLTGVQARLETPGAEAVAQRPTDTTYESVFVAGPDVEADDFRDLAGTRFTFGSESSTSGHLMPRSFLTEAGIDPESDFDGQPGYSGSHDKTWKLVEAGSFEAGVLSQSVWDRAVREGEIDPQRVREVARSPEYFDYHWVAHPDIDEIYGDGTIDRVVEALTGMHTAGPDAERILAMFEDDRFVETDSENYVRIEQVARDLGLVGG